MFRWVAELGLKDQELRGLIVFSGLVSVLSALLSYHAIVDRTLRLPGRMAQLRLEALQGWLIGGFTLSAALLFGGFMVGAIQVLRSCSRSKG